VATALASLGYPIELEALKPGGKGPAKVTNRVIISYEAMIRIE
jgi:hypothetical protein